MSGSREAMLWLPEAGPFKTRRVQGFPCATKWCAFLFSSGEESFARGKMFGSAEVCQPGEGETPFDRLGAESRDVRKPFASVRSLRADYWL